MHKHSTTQQKQVNKFSCVVGGHTQQKLISIVWAFLSI